MRGIVRLLGVAAMGFLLSTCGVAEQGEPAAWALPFIPDPGNGCSVISTPFSVANPWDHAHEALDFACKPGTAVLAAADGEVIGIQQVEVRGQARFRVQVAVDGEGLRLEYANLSRVSASPGDRLNQGETIGVSALGLHLAVWSESEGKYLDPADYLPLEALEAAP